VNDDHFLSSHTGIQWLTLTTYGEASSNDYIMKMIVVMSHVALVTD